MITSPIIGIAVARFPALSETFILNKVVGLREAGLDVQIFAQAPGDPAGQFLALQHHPDLKARLHYAPPARPLLQALTGGLLRVIVTACRHPGPFIRWLRHCWKHRRTHPAGFLKAAYTRLHFVGRRLDVLHIEFDTQALALLDLKEYLGCRLLLSSRGDFAKTTVLDHYPDVYSALYQNADGYHFISRYLLNAARRRGLDPAVPVWVIEPAVDLTLFSPPPPPPAPETGHPLRIVSVGRLAWERGFEFAMDAVACLHREGVPVRYTLIGDGPYREAVEFAARQWGLLQSGVVQIVGAIPQQRVRSHLAEADVFLHLALSEGFCNAVIEAQAMGLPVVASDAGGLPENVEDGVTGFVVPRRDAAAAAARLRMLAEDPALRRRMGLAGRARATARFDLKQQLAAFAALYQELAGHGKGGA